MCAAAVPKVCYRTSNVQRLTFRFPSMSKLELTFTEQEIQTKLAALPGWYYEDRMDPPLLQDRRLADHAHARERRRVRRGGRQSSS